MNLFITCLVVIKGLWVRLHFTSNYTLYNYYVTNKETLNLEPWENFCYRLASSELPVSTDHYYLLQWIVNQNVLLVNSSHRMLIVHYIYI